MYRAGGFLSRGDLCWEVFIDRVVGHMLDKQKNTTEKSVLIILVISRVFQQ